MSHDLENLAQAKKPGLIAEYILFLKENKKWFLIPILLAIALAGLLVFFASSAVAPFIYPLF